MAPKRGGSKQQQKLNVDQFTLLKKPMEHLGKQINVPGSCWQGRMLEEERDPTTRTPSRPRSQTIFAPQLPLHARYCETN
jgi:hypothetical protein